jgi:hypothetical protein
MVISRELALEPARDPASPNRNLLPVSAQLDGEGRLMVGGCRLSALARAYGGHGETVTANGSAGEAAKALRSAETAGWPHVSCGARTRRPPASNVGNSGSGSAANG